MTTTKNRFLYLAAAAALGLTLAACGGGDGGGDDSAGGDDTTTTEQTDGGGEATDDGAGDETGDDEAGDDDAGDTGASGGAECLAGTWEMTPEAMEEQVLAQLGADAEVSVEGTSTMTFDGSVVTTESHNTSSYSSEVEGTAIEGETTTDGTIVVNYTADDATITYDEVVSADGTISMTLGGQTTEQDLAETASAMPGMTQDYTCTDTELSLTVAAAGVEVTQTFTRA